MKLETYVSIKQTYEQAKNEIMDEYSWQSLCDAGLIVEATMKFKKLNPSKSLVECKKYIDTYNDYISNFKE